jgi:hypothetical protein
VAEVQAALKEGPGEESPAAAEPSPTPSSRSSRASTTTIDRMIARTSPYGSLRLMSAIIFAVGVALAAIVLLGGLAALIVIATSKDGSPLIAVAWFVGAVVAALVLFVGAKTASDLVRLWADVGDRARQVAQMLEESLSRSKDNSV